MRLGVAPCKCALVERATNVLSKCWVRAGCWMLGARASRPPASGGGGLKSAGRELHAQNCQALRVSPWCAASILSTSSLPRGTCVHNRCLRSIYMTTQIAIGSTLVSTVLGSIVVRPICGMQWTCSVGVVGRMYGGPGPTWKPEGERECSVRWTMARGGGGRGTHGKCWGNNDTSYLYYSMIYGTVTDY